MSWEFVYCPSCGEHQDKVGSCVEIMFCASCSNTWQEPQTNKKPKKSKKSVKNKDKQKVEEMNTEKALPDDLTDGERAILKRLAKAPLDLYWGRGGWCYDYLPKPAKRADFDKLARRLPSLVKVECARLMLDN